MSGDDIIKYDNKLEVYIFSASMLMNIYDIYLFACIIFKFAFPLNKKNS